MAKRQRKVQAEPGDEVSEVAVFLTYLISTVNPGVDRGATYELLYEMMQGPTDAEVAEHYGELIRSTAFNRKHGGETH